MNDSLKYFIYARKSTDREDKQVASIGDQIFEVQKIAQHKNLKVVDIITESKSAKEPGRKGFNSLLKRIQKGEAQGILCWKLNRLARNPIDGGQISWMLQQNIIQHIQTFGSEYRPKDNVIVMNVEFGMANQYVKDLSIDTRRGLRRKAQRGWFPSSLLPIGYLHNKSTSLTFGVDKEIIIDTEDFNIVKRLWELMLTGNYTIPELHEKSVVLGLRNKKNKPYHVNTIRKIFDNKFYAGYFKWKNEDDELIEVEGKHQKMISLDQFKDVQHILRGQSKPTHHKAQTLAYKGVLECGNCASAVCGDRKLQVICTSCKHKFSIKTKTSCPKCSLELSSMKKPVYVDHTYYRCTRRRKQCEERAIKEAEIENQITVLLRNIEINKEFSSYFINLLKSYNDGFAGDSKSKMKLKKQITKLKDKHLSYLDLRADGEINSDEFKLAREKTSNEIIKLEKELNQLEYSDRNLFKKLQNEIKLLEKAQEVYLNGCKSKKNEVLTGLRSNLKLKAKKLYFSMPITLYVLDEGFKVYSAYFGALEPKKDLVKYTSYACFEELNSLLLAVVCKTRTLNQESLKMVA